MDWKILSNEEQLQLINQRSAEIPQVIFKHSTRCSISSMAKSRLERAGMPPNTEFYYLDLIQHRNLSNRIAELYQVHHESPQVLIIRNSECIYDESHSGISMDEIAEQTAV